MQKHPLSLFSHFWSTRFLFEPLVSQRTYTSSCLAHARILNSDGIRRIVRLFSRNSCICKKPSLSRIWDNFQQINKWRKFHHPGAADDRQHPHHTTIHSVSGEDVPTSKSEDNKLTGRCLHRALSYVLHQLQNPLLMGTH